MIYLQTPSLFSRFFSFFAFENPPQLYRFWNWGAVVVALLATFTRIFKKIKFLILHIGRKRPFPDSLLHHLSIDFDLTDDDIDDDDEASNVSDDDEEDGPASPLSDDLKIYTNFKVKGSNDNLRLRRGRGDNHGDGFKWADFSTGKNVVKIWDRLGLSLGFDSFDDSSDSESVVSLWDFDRDPKISQNFQFSLHVSPTAASPAVILSARMNDKMDGVVLQAYDTRAKGQSPAAYAEWSPLQWSSVTSGGAEKVYVGDVGDRVVAVCDKRKFKTPVENVAAGDGDMWWEADGVNADEEFVDCWRSLKSSDWQ